MILNRVKWRSFSSKIVYGSLSLHGRMVYRLWCDDDEFVYGSSSSKDNASILIWHFFELLALTKFKILSFIHRHEREKSFCFLRYQN